MDTVNRVVIAVCGFCWVVLADPAIAQISSPTSLVHVRSRSPQIAALIQRGAERSATFRQLVATIDGSNGIVYIEDENCGHGVPACLHSVVTAGTHRFFRVKVNARNIDDYLTQMIAHELRHVVEVLEDPSVTDSAAMMRLYQRITREGNGEGAMETAAAIDAGNTVRAELRAFERRVAQ